MKYFLIIIQIVALIVIILNYFDVISNKCYSVLGYYTLFLCLIFTLYLKKIGMFD